MEVSVCIPIYNNCETVSFAVHSVLSNDEKPCEIILGDDASTDNSEIACNNIIASLPNENIIYYRNQVNLGCGRNLQKLMNTAKGDMVLYLCGDDVFVKNNVIRKVRKMAEFSDAVVIVRNYYWFIKTPLKPVRFKKIKNFNLPSFIDMFDQISGIAIRKSEFKGQFSNNPWVEMLSVANYFVMNNTPIFFMPEYTVGVRIQNNGSMKKNAFNESPTMLWYELFKWNKYIVKMIASKHEGLIQVKRFGGMSKWWREVKAMVKIDRGNLKCPRFWFYVLATGILPTKILGLCVSLYRSIPKKVRV
jgi:glycosyltransferase involved in cell wall biosynthesis